MEGAFWVIKTDEQKANAAAAVATCPVNPKKPFYVQIKTYAEKRSEAQSRLSHKWYAEISQQGKEYTAGQVKCRCKKRYGLPIMLEDEVFAPFWKHATAGNPGHEEIVEDIMPLTPITSIMNAKQMSQYLTDLQNEMGSKYKLTDPSMYGLERL